MRILVYGDSNSFGTGPTSTLGADVVLPKGARWADVMARGMPEADVIVEGLPGRTTVLDDPIEGAHMNGLRVLPAILGSHRPVDLFVLCLGTNDLKARFSLGAVDVALGVKRVILAVQASGFVRHILCVAPPEPLEAGDFAPLFRGVATRAKGMGPAVARVAHETGVAFLDAGALFQPDPLDGIHWSANSHAALGRAVSDAARKIMASP
jgi:lysophospholipase L1-like esterase